MTNIDPNLWGPHFWTTLHFIASAYDDNPNQSVKTAMKTFIRTIPVLLPCKECQDHAFDYIRKADVDAAVSNRSKLVAFFVDFHNAVNTRLDKPTIPLSTAINMYTSAKPYTFRPKVEIYNYLLTFLLITLLIFFVTDR
jgi:hypothetical protein